MGTGELGVVAGLLTAIPLIGPALVAGCLSCVGVGAAAGVGLTAALPPRWWLAGLAAAAVLAAVLEWRRVRRCQRTAAPLRAGVTLVIARDEDWCRILNGDALLSDQEMEPLERVTFSRADWSSDVYGLDEFAGPRTT